MNKSKDFLQHIEYFKESSALSFLVLLVSADLAFIALHFLSGLTSFSLTSDSDFQLTKDGGYPEIYQYIKEFWIMILILSVFVKTREIGYIAWATLSAYLLCDDALSIHERVGRIIANSLEFTPFLGLRLQDFGELAVTAIAAVLLLTLIGFFYLRGSNLFKKITRDLLVLLLVIAFFGVFVDMVHIPLKQLGWKMNFALGVIEDGGEMIAISMLACYVFLLNTRELDPNNTAFPIPKPTLSIVS